MAARILLAWGVFVPSAWIAVRTLGGGVATLMLSVVAKTDLDNAEIGGSRSKSPVR